MAAEKPAGCRAKNSPGAISPQHIRPGHVIFGGGAAGDEPLCELSFSMRSALAIFLMVVTLWQVTGGSRIDLATATLSIAAAWFLSLFLSD